MLNIWGRKTSSNVQALMWCIGELELPYVRHDVGHIYGGTDTDTFFELNPNRTVPVMQDGENPPLWETGAILRYLASRYASDTDFWPSDPLARANVDRWAEWAKINITLGFTMPIFWRVVRTPLEQRDPQAIKAAVAAFEKTLFFAEECLGKRTFLAGDQLSLADIQLGHVLYRYYDIQIERGVFPNLKTYYGALTTRPAFREHVMVSYDELRA